MGRPKIDLDGWRWLIESLIEAECTQVEMLAALKQRGVALSQSRLQVQLVRWGIRRFRAPVKETPELRERVAHCFHELRLSDEATTAQLKEDGFDVGASTVRRLRKRMGLYKKLSAEQAAEVEGQYVETLRAELAQGHQDFRREALYQQMRAKHNIVGRDRLYRLAKQVDPNRHKPFQRNKAPPRKDGEPEPVPASRPPPPPQSSYAISMDYRPDNASHLRLDISYAPPPPPNPATFRTSPYHEGNDYGHDEHNDYDSGSPGSDNGGDDVNPGPQYSVNLDRPLEHVLEDIRRAHARRHGQETVAYDYPEPRP